MYFEDLTPYRFHLISGIEYPDVLNVGWLDREHSYKKGGVEGGRIDRLKEIVIGNNVANVLVSKLRGVHPCNLCGERMETIKNAQGQHTLGSAQIWIPMPQYGCYYAAPSMILHYITSHGYSPPVGFWEAVTKFDLNKPFVAQDVYREKWAEAVNRKLQ